MGFNGFLKVFFLSIAFLTLGSVESYAQTLGETITNTFTSFQKLPNILSAFAYISGLFLAVSGLFKFKNHVDAPHQTPLSDGVKRFLVGGMFLSLPFVIEAVVGTIHGGDIHNELSQTGRSSLSGGQGMDQMIYNLMSDIYQPMTILLSVFSAIAGIILVMVGISRLMKSAQDGPRGPGGVGTIMTFIVAGVLLSWGTSMGTFNESIFGDRNVSTMASISSSVISNSTDAGKIQSVIEAVMAFVMLVGYIAFIRGWFVLKAFADGGQASLAQSLTFLFGGAMAINLGELVNVLQSSLGINAANTISFS